MKLSASLCLAFAALALACAIVTCAPNEQNDGVQETSKQLESARGRFQLPKLFDFARYKQLFKKSYSSMVEELARQKILLANAFKSLISMIKYKWRKAGHYLGVNQFSDRTQEELDRQKLHADKIRLVPQNSTPESQKSPVPNDAEADEAASLDDIQQVIADIEQHKSEPGYKEIADELERAQGANSRRKRSASRRQNSRASVSADNLIRSPEIDDESANSQRRVPSNNPEYEPPMLDSFGLDDDEEPPKSMSGRVINYIGGFSGIKYLSDMVQGTAAVLRGANADEDDDAMMVDAPDTLADVVYFDHREGDCFFHPRNQGNCGCCYAFAAVSLFEWEFCRQTGLLVPFSEQYIVDCGHYIGSNGCDGGIVNAPHKFVGQFGLELRADYPYRKKVDQCPYEPQTDTKTMGYIRYKKPGHKIIAAADIDEYLPKHPMLIGIMLPPDFSAYGGGVDEAVNCSPTDGHAMLMVGAGREDGKEYYLIRNSHSVAWGEQGYWKISKEAFHRCLLDGLGVISTGRFAGNAENLVSNPHYTSDPIKTRYQAYMNLQAIS